MTIYIRPSGTEIELASTKEMRAFAKKNGWKKKAQSDLLSGDEHGDSSAGNQGDSSGNTGSSE